MDQILFCRLWLSVTAAVNEVGQSNTTVTDIQKKWSAHEFHTYSFLTSSCCRVLRDCFSHLQNDVTVRVTWSTRKQIYADFFFKCISVLDS